MGQILQMKADELQNVYKNQPKDTVLLDVREEEEFIEGHIPGVQLLPMSEISERFEKELDKGKSYIVICRSGNRSQRVCEFLDAQGFEKLHNFDGGMLSWSGPVETGDK